MMNKVIAFLTVLTVAHCLPSVTADCIGSFKALKKLQVKRGANNTIPVTYVICPNTVFDLDVEQASWDLNSNAKYLCGENGSSTNNCIVTGGEFQLQIAFFPLSRSLKDNILLSGFTFEKAKTTSAAIASSGNFIIRDCIWKDHNNHAVLSLVFYIPPKLRRSRLLGSLLNDEGDDFDYRNDFHNYLKDPKLQEQRQKDRSLLIGGGSEPRLNLLLDRVQFLNNSLASVLEFPSVASNGPIDIITAFADVTLSKCLFKDNNYPYSRTIFEDGFAIRVASSSTINISDTCFVNNFIDSQQTVWITADSGLVSSKNNYVTESPSTSCQYIFMREAYKCVAPESSVCNLPTCAASYKLYDASSDKLVAKIKNGGTYTSPPCNVNIKVTLPCVTADSKVTLQLLRNGRVVRQRKETEPFFLFGNNNTDILSGTISPGTYTIQANVSGTILPSPATFTLAGTCKRNNK